MAEDAAAIRPCRPSDTASAVPEPDRVRLVPKRSVRSQALTHILLLWLMQSALRKVTEVFRQG